MTPMSCVTSMTAAPWSLHSRLSKEMICAWIDTSSAVVGSSANDQLGLGGQRQRDDHPLAHAAAELVRVLVDALLGRRMPVSCSSRMARWRASSKPTAGASGWSP